MQHIVISPTGAAPAAGTAYLVPDTREAIELAVEAFIARLDLLDARSNPDEPMFPCVAGFAPAGDGLAGDEGDAEDVDEDCCLAGDDGVFAGIVISDRRAVQTSYAGSDDDGELEFDANPIARQSDLPVRELRA